ncbi:hypothetical protein [Flavobacteriaceae bacterium 14752]|uniref:hypothetical protein n=1 Tax=Mesohalobacter salilacus TaxID=2491711 RepID=UPI000F631D2C|nr:hypothetical protein EIG84_02325 [Flavobacteriaceae bacterium 14752]
MIQFPPVPGNGDTGIDAAPIDTYLILGIVVGLIIGFFILFKQKIDFKKDILHFFNFKSMTK